MMNIKIENKNIDILQIESLKKHSGAALDHLWNTEWVKNSITRNDRQILPAVQEAADKLAEQSDIILVIAAGQAGRLVGAALSAAEPADRRCRVIVFGDTLSSMEYARLLQELEGKRFSIVAVSDGEEPVQLKGAYICLKQLLIRRHGKEQAAERLYAVTGGKSRYFAAEAAEEDFPMFSCGGISSHFGANTAMTLLPLAIIGADVSSYLDGFYDMLASPAWDLNAVDYAVARAACRKNFGTGEILQIWQKQLEDFGKWQGSGRLMPADEYTDDKNIFESQLLIEEDSSDVMMPYFEEGDEDGSLNRLMLRTAKEAFSGERPGVRLSLEVMNDYNLGQLFAFTQLSKGITEFLTEEK